MREVIRIVAVAAFVFMMAKDMKEILTEISNSPTVKPFVDWIYPHRTEQVHRAKRKVEDETNPADIPVVSPYTASYPTGPEDSEEHKKARTSPLQDPALDAVRKKLQLAGYTSVATGEPASTSDFSESEKSQIQTLKAHLTNVMQQWCLPKLVCELHASLSERSTLTEAERSLLALIRETSLGTMGEVVSRYHFAAHMGQLLSGVDGNGCHNLYPNCPLSGNKVLQLVKRVRIR